MLGTWICLLGSFLFFKKKFYLFIYLRERERERECVCVCVRTHTQQGGGAEEDGEAGSLLRGEPNIGLNLRTLGS